MNQTFFGWDESRAARQRALEQVEDSCSSTIWKLRMEQCCREVAGQGRPFTTDDVLRAYPELEGCGEKRLLGPILKKLAGEKLIRPLGFANSNRVVSHGRPKRLWKKV